MPNDVKLQEGHPVDENLRPIKVGGKSTALEVSKKDVRVNNFHVSGTYTGSAPDDGTKLPLAGGTMTGDITTDSNIVHNGSVFAVDASGDILLSAAGGDVNITTDSAAEVFIKMIHNDSDTNMFYVYGHDSSTEYFLVLVTADGATTIYTSNGGTNSADLTFNIDGDIVLDSHTGVFEMKKAGTKFADMYAGMILGYTDIGLNETHTTLSLTTSFVVPTDEFSVSFVAPPSGNVEIEFQIYMGFGSNGLGDLAADLSTANATSGYSQLAAHHAETYLANGARNGFATARGSWTLTGLTAGTSYEYWAAFKSDTTTGTPTINWGGSTQRYPDFIMKATALPASITT